MSAKVSSLGRTPHSSNPPASDWHIPKLSPITIDLAAEPEAGGRAAARTIMMNTTGVGRMIEPGWITAYITILMAYGIAEVHG